MKKIQIGDTVKVFDYDKACKDKDFDGTNQDYYPIGMVVRIYPKTSYFGYTDILCDIQVEDKFFHGHFVDAVTPISR